jgi:hypothetical protein
MRISKWHEAGGKAKPSRATKGRTHRPLVISHWIEVDAYAFERIETAAKARRISISRLVDQAINLILDREGA